MSEHVQVKVLSVEEALELTKNLEEVNKIIRKLGKLEKNSNLILDMNYSEDGLLSMQYYMPEGSKATKEQAKEMEKMAFKASGSANYYNNGIKSYVLRAMLEVDGH